MKKLINNFKKYNPYALYAAKAELKSEVANSYLTWIWWILDPLFFMLIYVFVVEYVFKTGGENLPLFVMSGLIIWNFLNKNIVTSVKLISSNKAIISQKYIPKYMLIIEKFYVNFIKFVISFIILIVMAILYRNPLSITYIYMIPLFILIFLLSFGVSNILAHFGVYIEDSANIVQIVLRLLFYLSGVFYSLGDRLTGTLYNVLVHLNPIGFIIEQFRNIFLYQQHLDWMMFLYWFVILLILSILSLKLINKYENSYAKVI